MSQFYETLIQAFAEFPIPSDILLGRGQPDSDSVEAIALVGKSWREVDADFWYDGWSAAFALNAEGLAYHLPAMLIASLSDAGDLVLTSLVGLFETSGDPALFPERLSSLWTKLSHEQIQCLLEWSAELQARGLFVDDVQRVRVEQTLSVLAENLG